VDHEERRREIGEAVWRAVARRGIDAATVREIAEEAGFSTGVLAHYFGGKEEVVLHALRVAAERAAGRMERARDGRLVGIEALRFVLQEALPLDEERREELRVWVQFWGRTVGNPALREEQNRWYGLWRGLVRGLISGGQRSGELRADLDPQREAEALVALVDGVGLQATFEPERFPPGRQVSLLEAHLDRLRSTP
jgi:AcrR family transcriptional regulator